MTFNVSHNVTTCPREIFLCLSHIQKENVWRGRPWFWSCFAGVPKTGARICLCHMQVFIIYINGIWIYSNDIFDCLYSSGLCFKPRVICSKSHMFCESCIFRLLKEPSQKDKCPTCRSKFSSKDIKSPVRPLVNILDLIMVKCPNKDWCQAGFQYDQLERHLKVSIQCYRKFKLF